MMSDQRANTNKAINHPTRKQIQDFEIDYWKAKLEQMKKELEESEAKRIKVENDFNKSEAERDKLSFKTLITVPPKVELSATSASTSSNVTSNAYKTAEIKEVEITFELESKHNNNGSTRSFELDDYLIEKSKACPSTLLLHFAKLNKMEQKNLLSYDYCSEADVSSLVQRALEDATYLAQCKTGRNFITRHEYSIFSLRPDHFVVLEDNVPLLTVEDKKPWNTKKKEKKDENIMETDLGHAYGQLYDYAMMMRAFGTHASFLVLTCFQESRMLWLDSNRGDANASYKNIEERDKNSAMSPPSSKQGKENTPSPLNFQSPDKNIKQISKQPQGKKGFQSLQDKRVLNASASFDSTHLVPLLYTAILRAVTEIPHKRSKLKIPLFENDTLNDYKTLKMGSEWRQYDWGLLTGTVGQEIDENNCYYLMDIIGMGRTSKVFYALHSSGKPSVIKMFVNRAIEDRNGETLSKKEWMKLAKKKTKTEKENFDNLYPFLKDEVKVEMILGFHCVVMPFFTPLKNNVE
jgi:hypothetical protein